ncbi:hypothetical protein GOP47_0020849 [Adiantum capillus-veneris]|uniref:Dymeclin n=1 Tax=Adiantum capillus-veneris TaxID=13818 RepID=A0A9D4Z7C8_ADICA|nr:hypothetical protein GOP47_0020849 [Adiantum capillus-veneris]
MLGFWFAVQNSKSTGHLAKLLIHLGWSLQEVSDSSTDVQLKFAKTTNAVRFSSVFLKYAIEQLTKEELRSCLSLSLSDKEADFSGLKEGNQNVAGFVVFGMLSFIANSDVNPSTYMLHLEIGNLLLVMMSTQLHQAGSPSFKSTDIFLDAAMLQEPALVSLVVHKLLLSYIARLPLPMDAPHYFKLSGPSQPGMLQRVGLAAAIVLRLPYYTYNYLVSSKSSTAMSPLATNSVLLLLVLVHHRVCLQFENNFERQLDVHGGDASMKSDLNHVENVYCQALNMAREREYADSTAAEFTLRISFTSLYDVLGLCLADECTVLLLYTLVHGNAAFLEYVLVRTDLDTLMMPLLEMLYDSPRKSVKQTYMLVIILLILSQDSSFNSSLHKLVLPGVSWFKDQILTQTTLGSLMFVILIRTVKYNLAALRDVYLHTNCLATLSNMAPHAYKLSAYASQRLVSLFEMLSRKYFKMANASKASDLRTDSFEAVQTIGDASAELHIYTDFLRLVFEIFNAILTYALPHNPEVVYALLHRQELFKPFQDHPLFTDLVENIISVLSHFNTHLDAQKDKGEWSVETVLQAIVAITRSWRGEGIKMFPQLRFTYEEDQCPEEFFVPYVWQLVVSYSGIAWNKDTITLFSPNPSLEAGGEDTNLHPFEMPSTPKVEV